MTELISTYISIGIVVGMMWPMLRQMEDDDHYRGVQKQGETGIEFSVKAIAAVLLWPIVFILASGIIIADYLIPWLITPKS